MPRKITYASATQGRPPVPDETKAERDKFYTRKPWRDCRSAFLMTNPLCRRCMSRGKATEATIPHHILGRLVRPDLAYDWDNLEPLCSPCHTAHHKGQMAWTKPIARPHETMHQEYNKERPMVLALDFNGVLHDHVRAKDGKGPVKPESPAVAGSIDFLKDKAEYFTIAILSARFARPGASGLESMIEARAWLIQQGIASDWITFDPDRSGRIFLSGSKVPYQVALDDRSIRFDGTFPTLQTLQSFKPWNVSN